MTSVPYGELLERLGVDLDAGTLQLALTHRSYAHEHPGTPHNERLEFLGDSVLGLAVTHELYVRFPEETEGSLAKRRAAVVSERSLARIARSLDVGRHIRLGHGEELNRGAEKDSILSDTMEALFGATFMVCGPDIARDLVLRFTADLLDDAYVLGAGRDWKTEIQELAASLGIGEVRYEVTATGPAHAREYESTILIGGTVRGVGLGTAKKQAERAAAEQAFHRLAETAQTTRAAGA